MDKEILEQASEILTNSSLTEGEVARLQLALFSFVLKSGAVLSDSQLRAVGSVRQRLPQRPSLFLYPDLSARPIQDPAQFSFTNVLEAKAALIADEYIAAMKNESAHHSFYFIKAGVWQTASMDICPVTTSLLKEIPMIAEGCAIGNVFFSVLPPDTHILSHAGATNILLRCHLPLFLPSLLDPVTNIRLIDLAMRVDSSIVTWSERKVLIFDPSYDHEEWYRPSFQRLASPRKSTDSSSKTSDSLAGSSRTLGPPATPPRMRTMNTVTQTPKRAFLGVEDCGNRGRVVLLIDFWHPELSAAEVAVLKQLLALFARH